MQKHFFEISYIKEKYPKIFKIFTILPGFLALMIIGIVFVGYWIFLINEQESHSDLIFFIALLILAYYFWWIIRGFEFILFTFMASFKMSKQKSIDFGKVLYGSNSLTNEEKVFRKKMKQDLKPDEIIHRFIIPTYKEDLKILVETCENILAADGDKKKFAITLAGEERDKENFEGISKEIKKIFGDKFGFFDYTVHPKDIEGELLGKGSNIYYSSKLQYQKILDHFQTTADKVLVTTLDADTNIDKQYPQILSYYYICADDRMNKSYQPIIFFFNNFWDAPFFSKIISLGNSFWILFNSLKKVGMRNFSTHAQPLDALIITDFWSKETIVEDGHQYRRSYFALDGKYECIPIFTQVYQDANLNSNLILTAKAQYNQLRRWAHGAEDLAYVFCEWIYNFKILPFGRTFYEFARLFEGTVLWSTLHLILMFGMTFTIIKDIPFSSFASLGNTISFFIRLSFLVFIFSVALQLSFAPWGKIKSKVALIYQIIEFLVLYWILSGPTLLIFSGLSALHTHVAIMLGKPMKKFNVTKKVRK